VAAFQAHAQQLGAYRWPLLLLGKLVETDVRFGAQNGLNS
jgi:hypothetical protein